MAGPCCGHPGSPDLSQHAGWAAHTGLSPDPSEHTAAMPGPCTRLTDKRAIGGPGWAVKGTAAWPQHLSPDHCPSVPDAPSACPCSWTCSLLAPGSIAQSCPPTPATTLPPPRQRPLPVSAAPSGAHPDPRLQEGRAAAP